MKGQLALELMLVLAATLVLVSSLTASILSERASIERQADGMEAISRAESSARAVEAGLHAGMRLSYGYPVLEYSIEAGRFHAPSFGKIIEIGGAFIADGDEPV